ncbi:MAG TPA: hypothetical protein VKX17_10700 [Planctomycetota bacterium]|nr:hypothetical protein [Planctomycetota bacterium]
MNHLDTKHRAYSQVPLSEWPHGLERELAVLRAFPDGLAARLDLKFMPSQDNLDSFVGALVELQNRKCFALLRHTHYPAPGTLIFANHNSNDLAQDFRDLMQALALTEDDFLWVAPEAAPGTANNVNLIEAASH